MSEGADTADLERDPGSETRPAKSKTLAVVLAAIFGPLTWGYTPRRDAWKLLVVVAGVYLLSLLVRLEWTQEEFNHEGQGWAVCGIPFYLWALIQTCNRPKQWFARYPRG